MTSPALSQPLLGTVSNVGQSIGASSRCAGSSVITFKPVIFTEVSRRFETWPRAWNYTRGLTRTEREHRAVVTLERIGTARHASQFPAELSGGQKQPVVIARALVHQPKVVLADEPTADLDKHTGREIVALLTELAHEQGTTTLLVTHDHRILDVADRILVMEDGRLVQRCDV